MKAELLNRRRFIVLSRSGRAIVVEMELFKVTDKKATCHPEGYRVGWIAFDSEDPEKRVLFDSHTPKGIHFHIDGEDVGTAFTWKSLAETERLFFEMVCRHFHIDEEELL